MFTHRNDLSQLVSQESGSQVRIEQHREDFGNSNKLKVFMLIGEVTISDAQAIDLGYNDFSELQVKEILKLVESYNA